MQKLAHYIANELITKRLANSRLFISAAVKTAEHVDKSTKLLEEASKRGFNTVAKESISKLNAKTAPTATKATSFLQEFADEFFKSGRRP